MRDSGLSLPDVALLLPLAGALGVSVTELLEGRRAVQEQRYSAAEVEALIRRALAFPVEPPERQQARVKRYLPVYLICCVLGVAEAQEISGEGTVSYFLQPTSCGGPMFSAKVEDYLARYDVPAREAVDVCWAQTCMTLEDTVEELNTILSPVLARRLEAKLWQALYYDYEFAQPFLPQLERNLRWLEGECAKLRGYQEQLSAKHIEKNDR